MKRIKIFTILSVLAILTVLFFSSAKTQPATTSNSGSLLWKISSDKQKAPSYLYGTLHLLPEKDFFLGEDALASLQSAQSLTLEIDVDLSIKEQISMVQRIMLPKGKTLKDYMSEEDYTNFHSYLCDSLAIKEGKINKYFKFKPFNLLAFICMEHYGDLKMYEQEFSKIAKENKIPINGLESIDEQLNIIEECGLDMHTPSGDDIYVIREYEKLKLIYQEKNLDALTLYMDNELAKEEKTSAELEAQLLSNRNINWIPQLDSIITNESSFIAVGAAHLGGENGLINLLRKKGYTVTTAHQPQKNK